MAESPKYKDFKGTYPSGTNYFDYLDWIRKKMHVAMKKENDGDVKFDDEKYLDAIPETESSEDDGSNQGNDEEEKTRRTKPGKNKNKKRVDDDDESFEVDSDDDTESEQSYDSQNVDDVDIDPGEYFKGFFAFALWGYIPAPGGEEYKSTIMQKQRNL